MTMNPKKWTLLVVLGAVVLLTAWELLHEAIGAGWLQ